MTGLAQLCRGLDTVKPRHADVHQDHIRAQLRQALYGLPAVDALGDDLESIARGEDPRQTGPDDRLVVDERHADHRVAASPAPIETFASSGSRQLTRQPSAVGPAVSSPPSAVARSRIPVKPYPGRSASPPAGPVVSATRHT